MSAVTSLDGSALSFGVYEELAFRTGVPSLGDREPLGPLVAYTMTKLLARVKAADVDRDLECLSLEK